MFCPECRVEYRPGFRRCSDCDVDLVYELPPEAPSPKKLPGEAWASGQIQDSEELRTIWEGDSALDCANTCRELQRGEIPYKVSQSLGGRYADMVVEWKFKLEVRATGYEQARKVLGYLDDDTEAAMKDAEASSGLELPAEDDLAVTAVQGDWNLRGWYPEDATLEVWSGNPTECGSMVEMSLKENRINYRVELQGEELKKVFVLPEDESRAREIVREVVEGEPPE